MCFLMYGYILLTLNSDILIIYQIEHTYCFAYTFIEHKYIRHISLFFNNLSNATLMLLHCLRRWASFNLSLFFVWRLLGYISTQQTQDIRSMLV